MREPVTICALAASGDVYAIFGGGLVIPPEYDGVLYQADRALVKLAPGAYNAALILQSLEGYDGTASTLYWTRRGRFPADLSIGELPDPGNPGVELTLDIGLDFEVADPVAAISRLLRDHERESYGSEAIPPLIEEDLRSLLDPMVAREKRENLFKPSIFHEMAGLTLTDYINNVFGDRGVRVAGVASMSFRGGRSGWPDADRDTQSPEAPPARPEREREPAREPAPRSSSARGSAWDDQDFELPTAATARPRQKTPEPSWKRPAEPAQDKRPASPPSPASAASGPPRERRPRAKASKAALAEFRVALGEAFLAAPWEKFVFLPDQETRGDFIRDLDPEALLSDDKILELSARLRPEEFDFRWSSHFFVDQEKLFDEDQMRRFQRIIATLPDPDEGGAPGGIIQAKEIVLDDRAAPAPPRPPSNDDDADEEDPEAAETQLAEESSDDDGDGRDDEASNETIAEGDDWAPPLRREPSPPPRKPVPESVPTPQAPRRPPSYLGEVEARFASVASEGSDGFGVVEERNFRPVTMVGESAVYAIEHVDPEEFGEIEAMLGATQTLRDKKGSRWTLALNNKSQLKFSRVKISIQSDSLTTAGFGLLHDLEPGGRRTLDLRVACGHSLRDGSLRLTAIAFVEGASLPCAYTAEGTVRFKPSALGEEHLVAIMSRGDADRPLTSSELNRYNVDVVETHGSLANTNNTRLFTLQPNSKLTQRLRERAPDAERGACPVCDNETSRREDACQACGSMLPDWFRREPVLLTREHSNARARVERARLWMEGESLDNSLFVALGGAVKLGRRQDNDFVLRVYAPDGQVDERRTTELSRQSGLIEQSQGGLARFTCMNRHGIRVDSKFVPCDQSLELPDDARFEFLNRQGEAVLALLVKVVYGSDAPGGPMGPQAIFLMQEGDPRRRGCLFLLKSVPFSFDEGTRPGDPPRLILPTPPTHMPEGRLIYHDECLWLAPMRPISIVGDRNRDRTEIEPEQIARLDDNARVDFKSAVLRVKVYRGSSNELL